MKRFLAYSFCLSLVGSSSLWAAEPPASHAPARERSDGAVAHRKSTDRTSPSWSPTPQEEADAKTFLEKNSPNRLDAVKRARTDGKVPPKLVRSYFELEALRAAEPDLYDIKVKQVQLEDNIFGLVETSKTKSAPDPDAALKAQVRQLINLRIEEHQKRLDKLKAITDAEQQKLNELKTNTEKMIEAEVERQKQSSDRITRPAGATNGTGSNSSNTPAKPAATPPVNYSGQIPDLQGRLQE